MDFVLVANEDLDFQIRSGEPSLLGLGEGL
jgi:hypothetical protein